MSGSDKWETTIPNQLSPLMRAIEAMERCLQEWGAGEEARYLAQLAVEELGTNIIKYGYDDQNEHAIRITVWPEQEVFRICMEDDGHEFNPCLSPEPDPTSRLEERVPGGWGLSLVRRLTAMEYERHANGNVVRVSVPRQPSSAEPC